MALLTLMRHGKSDWSYEVPDLDRPLAPRGKRQAPVTAQWLAKNMPPVDCVLVSPATRTRQTWKCMQPHLEGKKSVKYVDALYTDDGVDVIAALADCAKSTQHTMVVGHNPALDEAAHYLTRRAVVLKTSMCAVIELSGKVAAAKPGNAKLLYVGRAE